MPSGQEERLSQPFFFRDCWNQRKIFLSSHKHCVIRNSFQQNTINRHSVISGKTATWVSVQHARSSRRAETFSPGKKQLYKVSPNDDVWFAESKWDCWFASGKCDSVFMVEQISSVEGETCCSQLLPPAGGSHGRRCYSYVADWCSCSGSSAASEWGDVHSFVFLFVCFKFGGDIVRNFGNEAWKTF